MHSLRFESDPTGSSQHFFIREILNLLNDAADSITNTIFFLRFHNFFWRGSKKIVVGGDNFFLLLLFFWQSQNLLKGVNNQKFGGGFIFFLPVNIFFEGGIVYPDLHCHHSEGVFCENIKGPRDLGKYKSSE